MNEFGGYLFRLREASGLSLREAGAKIGISNTYLHQIEKGTRNPPRHEVLERLADAYGVSRAAVSEAAREPTQPPPCVHVWRFMYRDGQDALFHCEKCLKMGKRPLP